MLKGKRILITGATGQIGGSIADRIAPHNELWAFARFSAPGSRERLERLGVKCVYGDLAKGEFGALPREFDHVIHLAANTKPGTAEVGMVQNAEATGLLMNHVRSSGDFLHVSTCGVYSDHLDDLERKKTETDDVGGDTPFSPNYGPTKTAAEGVARTLARLLDLRTTIARMDVSYGGPYDDGGLPGNVLEKLIHKQPIRLPKSRKLKLTLIHDDDISDHLEHLFRAASVPAFVVNWGGPDGVFVEDWVRYLAGLVGVEPVFEFDDRMNLPHTILDTARGRSIGLEWKVPWPEGMRRMVQVRHPELTLYDVAAP